MKSKAMKSSKAAAPASPSTVMKTVIKTAPLHNTDTVTTPVGKHEQELWSKVSVKDIPDVGVVTKQYNKDVGHYVYGMLKKQSTFKCP